MKEVILNNGTKIPSIGVGVFRVEDANIAYETVKTALSVGYRHVDTAMIYGNEEAVGKAIQETNVPREELFITTKVWISNYGYEKAKASVEDQINAFNHGADAYIVKPFHPRQVISTIENLLSRQMLLKDYFNSSMSSVKVKDGIVLHPEDEELIQNVTDFIKNNIDDELLSPSSIAEFVGVSKATLYRKFKEIIDKTPSEFVRGIRLEYAAKLLRTTKLTVSEIMFKCGFSNKSYFYREFLKQYGVSPKDYRNQ